MYSSRRKLAVSLIHLKVRGVEGLLVDELHPRDVELLDGELPEPRQGEVPQEHPAPDPSARAIFSSEVW